MPKDFKFSCLLDFYGEMLTDKQRDAIDYYYNEDMSLAEISQNLGITRQGVRDAVKRAEVLLSEMEERLGLVKRFFEMDKGLNKILEESKKIQQYNNKYVLSRDIRESAEAIQETVEKLCK